MGRYKEKDMRQSHELCGYEDCFGGPCRLPKGHKNAHNDFKK